MKKYLSLLAFLFAAFLILNCGGSNVSVNKQDEAGYAERQYLQSKFNRLGLPFNTTNVITHEINENQFKVQVQYSTPDYTGRGSSEGFKNFKVYYTNDTYEVEEVE